MKFDLCKNLWYDHRKLLRQAEFKRRVRCAFGNVFIQSRVMGTIFYHEHHTRCCSGLFRANFELLLLPATSLPIFSLLLLNYLGIGVERAFISLRRLEAAHELVLVRLGMFGKSLQIILWKYNTKNWKKITPPVSLPPFCSPLALPFPLPSSCHT